MNQTTIDQADSTSLKSRPPCPRRRPRFSSITSSQIEKRQAHASSESISQRLRTITPPATSTSTCSQAEALSGWKMKAPLLSSAPESCSFSDVEPYTRSRRSWKTLSFSSPSIRRAAIQRTSCLSIRRTASPKISLGPISSVCSFSSSLESTETVLSDDRTTQIGVRPWRRLEQARRSRKITDVRYPRNSGANIQI
jgi:hypothetical protein